MKRLGFPYIAVILASVPVVVADSISTATVRAAANVSAEELKSCLIDDVKSQLLRRRDSYERSSQSSRNPDCYIAAIGKPKRLIERLVSQPETSLDAQCVNRLTSTMASIELSLFSFLSVDVPSAQALGVKKLRDQVKNDLTEAIDYCEIKR